MISRIKTHVGRLVRAQRLPIPFTRFAAENTSAISFLECLFDESHGRSLAELSSAINRLGFRIVKQVQGGDPGLVYFVNHAA